MQAFTTLTGIAAPLPKANVDTDQIIPARFLKSISRSGFGKNLFANFRYKEDGSENPDFVLNQAPWREAPILVAGRNFGCGSSREGAVWALLARGIRCVVAESFGDIFHANCFQNGVLPVRLPADALARARAACTPQAAWEMDLRAQRILLPDGTALAFEVDPLRRTALLEGLDDIGRTLQLHENIDAWQARDRTARPWIWRPAPGATTEA